MQAVKDRYSSKYECSENNWTYHFHNFLPMCISQSGCCAFAWRRCPFLGMCLAKCVENMIPECFSDKFHYVIHFINVFQRRKTSSSWEISTTKLCDKPYRQTLVLEGKEKNSRLASEYGVMHKGRTIIARARVASGKKCGLLLIDAFVRDVPLKPLNRTA